MKTQTVIIKEFKALTDVSLDFNGHHILLMGDNGVGKSTVQQFIEIALGKQKNVPPNAKGSGEVVFDKDGNQITVKVKFKDGKPVLDIRGSGISIDNKKGAIADLFGAIDFDIDEFVNLSKTTSGRKEQVDVFKKFLPLEVQQELMKHENNVKNAFTERAELNKDIKKLEGSMSLHQLNNLPDFELTKIVHTDTDEVMALLKSANDHNAKILKVESGLTERENKISDKKAQIEKLKAQIKTLETENEAIEKEIKDGKKWLAKPENEKKDITVYEKSISDAADNNLKHQQAQALLKDRKHHEKLKDESGELTAKIESSREAIANAIRDMDSPVEGLMFDDEQLVYKGVPVSPDSLSKSEIMELGVRLKMAENPDLGILLIKEGESLGTDRINVIKQLADENGWQIIMEQVERGKEFHFEIMGDNA